jgi:hypothetical protein
VGKRTIECGNCGAELTTNDTECPLCHSTIKKTSLELSNNIAVQDKKLKMKQKDSSGFKKLEVTTHHKRGIKSGRPSKDEIIIDRTDPKKTTKIHKIWEQNEQGKWEEVPHPSKEFPAKHRKPKSASK